MSISTNGGQIQSTFAQDYHVPSITFMAFFQIARSPYSYNFSSPKGRKGNKKICIFYRRSLMNFCCKHLFSKMILKLSLRRVKLQENNCVSKKIAPSYLIQSILSFTKIFMQFSIIAVIFHLMQF